MNFILCAGHRHLFLSCAQPSKKSVDTKRLASFSIKFIYMASCFQF